MRIRKTHFCLLVFGFHSAIAVSLFGLKKIEPSWRLTSNPIPCDDFFPTNRIGNSAPNGNGPARNALVLIENSLKITISNQNQIDTAFKWKLFSTATTKWFIFFRGQNAPRSTWEMILKNWTDILRNIAHGGGARIYEVCDNLMRLNCITCQLPAAGSRQRRHLHQTPIQQCRPLAWNVGPECSIAQNLDRDTLPDVSSATLDHVRYHKQQVLRSKTSIENKLESQCRLTGFVPGSTVSVI